MNILLYLNDEDLKKLSFVNSENREEMYGLYHEYMEMRQLARKIHYVTFDHRHLTYHDVRVIREVNMFIDSLVTPLNVPNENVESYDLLMIKESPFIISCEDDMENIKSALKCGQKLNKELLNTIILRDRFRCMYLIEFMIDLYGDKDFVRSILPMKAVAFLISRDKHYIKMLRFYMIFGFDFIRELVKYLDPIKFMYDFLKNTRIYLKRIENLNEQYDEIPNYRFCQEGLEDIELEAKYLLDLIDDCKKEYPFLEEMSISIQKGTKNINLENICRDIRCAMSDVVYLINMNRVET
jgi:hypothetical protein